MTVVIRAAMDQGLVTLQRQLRALAPDIALITDGEQPLERATPDARPPRLVRADLLEAGVLRVRPVSGDPVATFAAFLDGTQTSRVVAYVDGTPIVHGTVAAAVRMRRNRRLTTWRQPIVERRLYACVRALKPDYRRVLEDLDIAVVDTTPASEDPSAHPYILQNEAVHKVQEHREKAEIRLAEQWCADERAPLFVDGSISENDRVAVSAYAVGVVKTHRTLYAEGDALQTILAMRSGERSSVFRVTSPKRVPVASWYLRLRDPLGHDPMWGLVRVEMAHPARNDSDSVGARADRISLWILAEISPLALPDARWDKMVYGIRDCEEFLNAVT